MSTVRSTSFPFAGIAALALLSMALNACNPPLAAREEQPAPGPVTHPESVHEPEFLRSVPGDVRGPFAQELRVQCETCHSLRESEELPASTEELEEFHSDLDFEHGELGCASCHVPGDVNSLKLADGRRLPVAEVMTLCGQCHGTQLRNYEHGAHGGMRGYWDRSRGPRTRNNCVDCHDPHTPAYVGGMPVFPPRDRFLDWNEGARSE